MNIRINAKGVTITLTDSEFFDIDSAIVSAHDRVYICDEFKEKLGEKYLSKFTEIYDKLLKLNR